MFNNIVGCFVIKALMSSFLARYEHFMEIPLVVLKIYSELFEGFFQQKDKDVLETCHITSLEEVKIKKILQGMILECQKCDFTLIYRPGRHAVTDVPL